MVGSSEWTRCQDGGALLMAPLVFVNVMSDCSACQTRPCRPCIAFRFGDNRPAHHGGPMPHISDFHAQRIDGSPLALAELSGRVLLIV
ncbi:MAG: hypothetical protein EBT70_12615, partial [Betaproteobacteria bacterium]|nr:hypothetical protein [Betaproteobacteria bacterium]